MDIDKVYIPLLPQGHKVKFKVTKVIAVFLPILLGFHLLGVLDCLPLVADTISLDMLVSNYSVSHNDFAFSIEVLRQFRLSDYKTISA